jgi:hypothetical protein
MRTLALSLAVAVTACSSSYTPQSRGRVSVMMQSGQHAYVRDGKTYEHGFLGGGLVDVVQGNPAAERAANEYHDRMTWGAIGVLGGMLCSLGGLGYAISQIDDNGTGSNDNSRARTGLYVALGCTVVMMIGTVYLASAEPYRWDAINLFNDAPPPLYMPGQPGWRAEVTGQPQQSLKMRD